MAACLFALSGFSVAQAETPSSSGSGFAITSDGWILTNAHVVKDCRRIEVPGQGVASVPRLDAANDLALIKVDAARPLAPLQLRRAPIRLGEDIIAIGYPLSGLLSDSIKITTGNVNALAGLQNDTRFLQISTPIQPGNSGGPVVDRDGFLLGITTATFSKKVADEIGITAQNVNFAIRASVADMFLQAQSVSVRFGERAPEQAALSTADLADKIAPSVFQILCYGGAEGQPSAAASSPQPAGAGLIERTGYDAIGFDYQLIREISYADCRASCVGDSRCQAITYNVKHKACFLKNNVMALIHNTDAQAAYSAAKAASVIVSDFTSYSGIDMPGGDYGRLNQTTYLDCFVACLGDNACRAFAYIAKKKECWLKERLGSAEPKKGVDLGVK
ncbi:trypsin-like peptidase domain-containing protein [Rhizobium rhizosphaerae]|uniref:trypsin-like peptidase domain-containing protein n=1 Tax=Xaviernesmea rhizosphaerae TaxID=1672749 RepID=UPI001FD93D29|nr:trypsin-like peptidase domain-containing protein [Xaviernesmea rhizosphaerae]